MRSFKLLKFYKKPSETNIKNISCLFSNKPYYEEIKENIYLFDYEVENFIKNQKTINLYISQFYFLIMTEYKFLDILKNSQFLGINVPVNASFKFNTGEELDETQVEELQIYNLIDSNDVVRLKKVLDNYDIHFSQLEMNINNNEIIVDEYGNIYADEINEDLNRLCMFVFEGKR